MQIKSTQELKEVVTHTLNENIIPFWLTYSRDAENGGFFGRISNDLKVDPTAPRGLILYARILWAFSALYKFRPEAQYLELAQRAYNYLVSAFLDKEYGGFYWMVDYQGKVIDDLKKIYGQAFAIYALCEYYTASSDRSALKLAIDVFKLIEKHNHDNQFGGYFESSYRDWKIADNVALSEVDLAEKKSMNTHLHLMEAYTSLSREWRNEQVQNRLKELIECHLDHILNPTSYHLQLFFDERWTAKSAVISFGHDIEASWLLTEAAEMLDNSQLISKLANICLQMVNATLAAGISEQGGLFMEMDGDGKIIPRNIDWWPQVEAIIACLNFYQQLKNEFYLNHALRFWNFLDKYFIDHQNGEWFYSVSPEGVPDSQRLKVCEWKGPYHNIRGCIEILKRLEKIGNNLKGS
jgi:mannobiose 2-epimerase